MKEEKIKIGKSIAFYPELARRLGSIPCAILYQHIHFWSDKGIREDGYIFKSRREIEVETAITVKQQRLAEEKLVELGWLDIKKEMAYGHPTNHYKALVSLNMVLKLKNSAKSTHLPKSKVVPPQRANGMCPKGKCITDNTTDKTTDTLATTVAPVISEPSVVPLRKDSDIIAVFDEFKESGLNLTPKYSNKSQRKACTDMIKSYGLETVLKFVRFASRAKSMNLKGDRFAPIIGNPWELSEKLTSLEAWGAKLKGNKAKEITDEKTDELIQLEAKRYEN